MNINVKESLNFLKNLFKIWIIKKYPCWIQIHFFWFNKSRILDLHQKEMIPKHWLYYEQNLTVLIHEYL